MKLSSKGCVLQVGLMYPEELRELHNDYDFVPDKVEIKRKMLPNDQINIGDF